MCTCCFQVLQHAVENQLKLYTKGTLVPVAQVTVNSLTRLVMCLGNYITVHAWYSVAFLVATYSQLQNCWL